MVIGLHIIFDCVEVETQELTVHAHFLDPACGQALNYLNRFDRSNGILIHLNYSPNICNNPQDQSMDVIDLRDQFKGQSSNNEVHNFLKPYSSSTQIKIGIIFKL